MGSTIADWLRTTCAGARRRIGDAERLAARATITGETLAPELPATAAAWRTVCWTSSTCG